MVCYAQHTWKPPLALPPLSGTELITHAWSDDEIDCYCYVPPPGGPAFGPCIGHLFDMRLRRWYTISTEHYKTHVSPSGNELEDSYWFDILKKTGHRGREDFDHIDVDPVDGSLTLSNRYLEAPNWLETHPPPSSPAHPHIHFSALKDRKYLEYSVETCMWQGKFCILKQILMQCNIQMIDAEISMNARLAHSPHIVPIIAYVVDDDGDLRGILLPWAGVKIDSLPSVRWSYFCDIAYGLRDIHSLVVSDSGEHRASHGDIFCRNILVKDGVAHLIDLDNQGLDYPGDSEAFANVIKSLKDKAEEQKDKDRMDDLENLLRAGIDFSEVAEKMAEW